jgi:benzoate-CoA ligase family protein
MPPEFPSHLNLATHFLDARLAEGLGTRVAIHTHEGTHTYADIAAASARYAHALLAAGIRPEERVIIALPDGPAYVAALFATWRVGSVVVMVNPDLPQEALGYFFEYSRARAAFVGSPALATYAAAVHDLPVAPVLLPVGDRGFEQTVATYPDLYEPFATHRDDPAIWLFSGGTTGKPKAVVQTPGGFANAAERYGRGVLGLRATDITIAVPKLFFGYATGANVLFPFLVGASSVLFPEKSTASTLFELIARYRPTVLVNVPSMVQQMVSHPGAAAQDLSCLRVATSAGEALPAEMYERWRRTFNVDLLDGLGTAEMWHIFISNRIGRVVPGTIGWVVDGYEVKLCDDDGRAVADGAEGALWVKGASRGLCYWQRLEETMRTFRGEWTVTGDLLRKNADGTFVYRGRADDMLKVSGRWLAPAEVENCLLQHAAVREVAVVPFKNPDGLVKPIAFVVPMGKGGDELREELQEFVRSRLEPFKCPRDVVFLEQLPRTHLNKIDRNALAKWGRD